MPDNDSQHQQDQGDGKKPSAVYEREPAPEQFGNRDYWKLLRDENASQRMRRKDAESKLAEAHTAAEQAKKDAEDRVTAAEKAAGERILRAELKAAAKDAGMIDLDGLKLADLSKVKLNDKGDIEGAEELFAQLKESKPYLFGTTGSTSSTEKPPKKPDHGKPKNVNEMTDAERAAEAKKLGITVPL